MRGLILVVCLTCCSLNAAYLPRGEDDAYATYIANADGSGLKRVYGESWARWSPDGRHLILATKDSILRVDANGGEPTLLFKHPGCLGIRYPTVSPSGRYLAATIHAGARGRITGGLRIWNLATGKVVSTDWLYNDCSPPGCGSWSRPSMAWHPTRDDLVYTRYHDNEAPEQRGLAYRRARVWTSRANTPLAVYDLPVPLYHAAWSAAGDDLLFTTDSRLWTMNRAKGADSARRTAVATDSARSLVPLRGAGDALWLGARPQFRRLDNTRLDPVLPDEYGSEVLWAGSQGELLVGVPSGDYGERLEVYRGRVGQPFRSFRHTYGLRTLDPWVSVSRGGRRIAWSCHAGTMAGWPEMGP